MFLNKDKSVFSRIAIILLSFGIKSNAWADFKTMYNV